MYGSFTMARKYLQYLLHAQNGRGHGVHSPFVYAFIREVLMDQQLYPVYLTAENYRNQLLKDETLLDVQDLGAGSRTGNSRQRRVADIARSAVKPKKYGRLLYRMAKYYSYNHILELGTSLGVTTTYLSGLGEQAMIRTIEGSEAIASNAAEHFHREQLHQVKLIRGHFDEVLSPVLAEMKQVDMAFIDGNHRYEPTMRYFKDLLKVVPASGCMVFDDIHWSAGMERAWEEIQTHPSVTVSIDLFFIGLVFFRPDFYQQQAFTVRF
jgi:predicted O-methyltransferase YrrM